MALAAVFPPHLNISKVLACLAVQDAVFLKRGSHLLVAVTFAWEERKPRGQDSWMLGTAIQMVKRVDCRGIGVV